MLLLDGVFLLRPELIDLWDLSIFVSAAFEQILDRARIRDLARLGSTAEVERRDCCEVVVSNVLERTR